MDDLPDTLFQRWYLSTEESTDDEQVYRPADHRFPRSRAPRPSVEFRPDGSYVEYRPGPADGEVPVLGRWGRAGDGRVDAQVAGAAPRHVTHEQADVLRVRS